MTSAVRTEEDSFIASFSKEANWEEGQQPQHEKTKINKKVVGVAVACVVAGCWLCLPFAAPAFRKHCVPYVPATEHQINMVLKMRKNPNGYLVDIGSGDGRLVIEAAKRGAKAEGIELNRWLVLYSRYKAWRAGVSHKTKFYHKDLWKFDLSKYETLVVFGTREMMNDLEKKLEKEMRDDAELIAGRFGMSKWEPNKQILDPKRQYGLHNVFVYDKQIRHGTEHDNVKVKKV